MDKKGIHLKKNPTEMRAIFNVLLSNYIESHWFLSEAQIALVNNEFPKSELLSTAAAGYV